MDECCLLFCAHRHISAVLVDDKTTPRTSIKIENYDVQIFLILDSILEHCYLRNVLFSIGYARRYYVDFKSYLGLVCRSVGHCPCVCCEQCATYKGEFFFPPTLSLT